MAKPSSTKPDSRQPDSRKPDIPRWRTSWLPYSHWKILVTWSTRATWESMSTGYLLREAREEAGLTQNELAKRLGCTQQAVAKAERWKSNPTVGFVRRWCRALDAELILRIDVPLE